MQKLNFLLAFFVAFFIGCTDSNDAVDCGCATAAAPVAEAPPAEEAVEVAPAVESTAPEAAPAVESTVSPASETTAVAPEPAAETH
jgi:hypothetical protein